MEKVQSAGGVVFYKNRILLLKKRNGFWVLPKGHIEAGETKREAALREVKEEASVEAEILQYLDDIEYTFRDFRNDNVEVHKRVSWFIMLSKIENSKPQFEEGFVESSYIDMDKAENYAKHQDESRIIKKAIEIYKEKYEFLIWFKKQSY